MALLLGAGRRVVYGRTMLMASETVKRLQGRLHVHRVLGGRHCVGKIDRGP